MAQDYLLKSSPRLKYLQELKNQEQESAASSMNTRAASSPAPDNSALLESINAQMATLAALLNQQAVPQEVPAESANNNWKIIPRRDAADKTLSYLVKPEGDSNGYVLTPRYDGADKIISYDMKSSED
jgi:hypothetical protein